ncbi:ABC transporter ATP-binding protein [Dactylosporangium sp. NPDC051484]|uniref:ABC transporter ATP-binding protein n=1 Tax=Dactylosporangium sp. NPDC051484 TaxID=3154942 RepID=UPI00344B5B32
MRAVDGVSLDLTAGEIVTVVGESGCGKTTLARTLVGMHPPAAGEIRVDGVPLGRGNAALRALRRQVQIVPQDPGGALDPRRTVYDAVAEGLRIHRVRPDGGEPAAVVCALARAGLPEPETLLGRYPHELSGGQRQRVLIAGALIMGPRVLIADEPVSSLDAAARAEVLTTLLDLRDRSGLTALVISHDLEVARCIADRVAVMYLGRIVELGPAREVLSSPTHPYTAALLAATPRRFVPVRATLKGEPSPLSSLPGGCRFHSRCPVLAAGMADAAGVGSACRTVEPAPLPARGSAVACHFAAAAARRP